MPGSRGKPSPYANPNEEAVSRMDSSPRSLSPDAPAAVHPLHAWEAGRVLQTLGVSAANGLSEAQALERRQTFGPNELVERGAKSPWAILFEQFTAFLVVVLILAAVISAFLGEWKDAVAIVFIVVLNALMGLIQEYRAEKAIAALKRMARPRVRVRRGGRLIDVSASELVPGDLLPLEAGMHVPADGRILEAAGLQIAEAALTGESVPVDKTAACVPEAAPLAERASMAYLGTTVAGGRGLLAVTHTGMGTELGKIAALIQTVKPEPTPLQRRLDGLGRMLSGVAFVIVAVVAVLGWLRGEEVRTLFMTAVSLAVAAVPEGLPAVVTIALALGSQRMLARRALIRRLTAVETLGSVTVICTDKTGTLTENRMQVVRLDLPGRTLEARDGAFFQASGDPAVCVLLAGAALSSDAALQTDEAGRPVSLGDPTETALVLAAASSGLEKPGLERAFPRVCEAPFDSVRKRMATAHRVQPGADAVSGRLRPWAQELGADGVVFVKGSTDGLLGCCDRIWEGKEVRALGEYDRKALEERNDQLSSLGFRMLGLAYREWKDGGGTAAGDLERGLVFVGMLGLVDPVRAQAPEAVRRCNEAGIVPVMITGDHPLTARAVARGCGLGEGGEALRGSDLDALPPGDLAAAVLRARVCARVSPEHKLRIVRALQEAGHVVAMTGDGVNDAPALKQADIGVAMGLAGTDVAREASAMVLQDDNFATIVAAVGQGRVIYDNIRRFIRYILGSNSGELWVMLLGPFLGMPLPLLSVQILWMNLVTDSLPALALGVEPAEKDVMRRPPRAPGAPLIDRGMGAQIVWVGLIMAAVSLLAGFYHWDRGAPESWHTAQTMIFTVMVLSQMGIALAVRSDTESLWARGLWTNVPLCLAVGVTVLLQVAAVYAPVLRQFFRTVPLSGAELLFSFAVASVPMALLEFEKWVRRRQGRPV